MQWTDSAVMIALRKASYVVEFPIPAIATLPKRRSFLTVLCPGSVIKFICQPNDMGLVRVQSGDCEYKVFMDDLKWYASPAAATEVPEGL
jgi:hypothetical protein